jgi:lysozyme family protein
MADFFKGLEDVLESEGLFSNDSSDSGGETMYGITKATAQRHNWTGEMKELPLDLAKHIYKIDYWNRLKCNIIESQVLANYLFDTGVNMGVGKAGRFFQIAICITGKKNLKVDGNIGQNTIKEYKNVDNDMSLLLWMTALRCDRYNDIVKRHSKNSKFLKGWMRRALKWVDKYIENNFLKEVR